MSELSREIRFALHAAVQEAVSRRHAYLTLEHLLFALIHDDRGAEVLTHCGVDLACLKKELERFFREDLEAVPGDDALEPQQTIAFLRVLRHALLHAQSAEQKTFDAGDLIAALFDETDSYARALLESQEVSRLDVLRFITHGVSKLPGSMSTPNSVHGTETDSVFSPGSPSDAETAGDSTAPNPLEAFTINLSKLAAEGKLDPLIGRGKEIERAIHVLARRRKNNPLFVGEPGVGKTALAEGLAQRIGRGQVPPDLAEAEIFALDLGALLAGTRFRGDFEERFKTLMHQLQQRKQPILFLDEIHTILGAGTTMGSTMDASNLLKPLLAEGKIRFLGSTTFREFRNVEKDHAFARRFQRIDIQEPSETESLRILQGLAPHYETHHGVKYTPSALKRCVELSVRHLPDRFLPDKAIDVMDETGAAVRLRPTKQKRKTVTPRDVEAVVARIAQVPVARAAESDLAQLAHLEENLQAQVFGQDPAVHTVAAAIKRSRAGLGGAHKPIGSFLFMGPTGVGKTELARQLAQEMGVPFLRFDMSEYVEKHAVARLIGAPPGYVGYDEGGLLVQKIRQSPHAILLLDEIEKAHPDLFDILLQVMDRATLTDNQGREAHFENIILIMTSNVGARELSATSVGFEAQTRGSGKQELERLFSPEFRNRLDAVVRFDKLDSRAMLRIVEKFLVEVQAQLRERQITLETSDAAKSWLAEKGFDPNFGARPLGRLIQTEINDKLADAILFGALLHGGTAALDVRDDALHFTLTPLARAPRSTPASA